MRLLIINPGSTSTKISVYDNEQEKFTESVFHDAPVLLKYNSTSDQLKMRLDVVKQLLEKHSITLESIDLFVGRGGCAASQKEGVMMIDETLYTDTEKDVGGSDHAAKLGVMMAYHLGKSFDRPAFTLNPTNVDELSPCARITGIKGVYRRAQSHVLNQKGIARLHAQKSGKEYEKSRYIVCHIDGGITIAAHENGKMVDGTEGAGGDGPFTPTRLGSIPVTEVARYAALHSPEKLIEMCSRSGGFVSHFGTSNSDTIHKMKTDGDEHAALVWDTMVYQICKSIGEMACVLSGKVDAILLTGGLIRFDDIVETVKERCGWIAPVFCYPGEIEQEVLAHTCLEAARGKKPVHRYTGEPVFRGWDWDR